MERDGEVLRLARGLYQLADATLDAHHSLAEAAKRVPKGVVCLVSALAFHELTDQLPRQIWIAIRQKDWPPKADGTPIRLVRFTDRLLEEGVETHLVEGVPVKVFGVAKTIADCFRYRNKIGLSVAIEGLQEALRQRKATAGEIAGQAERGGVATVDPALSRCADCQWLRRSRTSAPRCTQTARACTHNARIGRDMTGVPR